MMVSNTPSTNDSNLKQTRTKTALVPCLVVCALAGGVTLFSARTSYAQSAAAAQAMAAQQQGNFAEAEKDWRAAVAQDPRDAVAYANLGFVLAHQNKYAEAVPAYRKAAKLAPTAERIGPLASEIITT